MKLSQDDSPYFRFIAPPNVAQKVGPGLALSFRVQFSPQENKVCIYKVFSINVICHKYLIHSVFFILRLHSACFNNQNLIRSKNYNVFILNFLGLSS